ncbi:MAG TPA: hypothetical protein VK530_03160, partial [Candidatus Acidoferrum sp.]|nr:hypothetical protein [Candidatus Acidoferrum sp.]
MNARSRFTPYFRQWLCLLPYLLLCSVAALPVRAQTTILADGFESAFPGVWTATDTNGLDGTFTWRDVNSTFGGESTHGGNWKAYCAGTRYPFNSLELNPTYTNHMDGFITAPINLAGFSRANLRFWSKIPDIEVCCDVARVYIDNTLVWSTNGPMTNWTETVIDLNSFAGAAHTLKFWFHTDQSVIREGWYLDDLEVSAGTSPVTDSLVTLDYTNYTGYIIDSDSNNPAFNRESMLLNTVVSAENFQTNATNYAYRFTYRLRDTNGAIFPIYDFNGQTNAAYTYVSTNTVSLAAGAQTNTTNFASIRPAARLNHLTLYRIEVDVARVGGAVIFKATNGPLPFYHFTNNISGDPSYNVIAEFKNSGIERSFIIDLAPGSNTFSITNTFALRRYDGFSNGFPGAVALPIRLDVEMRPVTNNSLTVPLVNAFSNYTVLLSDYQFLSSPTAPFTTTNSVVLNIRPQTQLNSVDSQYRVIVRMSYTNTPGQPSLAVASITNSPTQFLHFNGHLEFNDIDTTFTSVNSPPPPGAVTPGISITSSLFVSANAGTVVGEPNHHYSGIFGLPVKLNIDGTAIYTGGTITLSGPSSDTVGNIRFQRTGQVLDANGARATVLFTMPTGFGYNTNLIEALIPRRLLSDVTFLNIGLSQSLAPKSNLVWTANMFATEESKPLWIQANALTWDVANSQFLFSPVGFQVIHVRKFDYGALANQTTNLFNTNMAVKLANDRYFDFTLNLNGVPSVKADALGNALMAIDINFSNGVFRTHFPYNTSISWSNSGGRMKIVDDVVQVGATSKLPSVGPIMTPYVSSCEGCSGLGSTNFIGLQPPGAELYFTRDGGLVTAGPSVTPLYASLGSPSLANKLAWGYVPSQAAYAQSMLTPTNISFAMAGTFLRGTDNTASSDDGPGVILYTGVNSTNHALLERPDTTPYEKGFADYSGMNLRALGDDFRSGKSLIAGQNVDYKLRGNSKYYARLGGVSGIHSATGGSFPTNLTLLGYSFTFSNYSLSYLDGENLGSRTEGLLRVPYPSDFTLAFEKLKFTCPGGLDDAEIQGGSSTNKLQYWNGDFEALGIEFVSNPGEECDPGKGSLTVGVNAWASYVTDALHGILGFNTNGTLIPKSQGLVGIDSRLQMPGNFKMKGPNGTDYVISPVGNAYYNKFDSTRVALGFITFAGKMNIPFFEDLKVQVQTSPIRGGTNGSVHLMGGWPRVGSGNPNLGWVDGATKDYFTAAYFDEDNAGLPPGPLTLANYRNSPIPKYHPRAVKSWLDIVDFDYPLTWNDTLRSFKSFVTQTNKLIVIEATHEITYMDAKTASLDFGIKYDGLPKISIGNFLVNELDEATGAFSAITDVIGEGATTVLDKGLEGFNTLLADNAEKLIDELFDATVDPIINTAYSQLQSIYNGLPANQKTNFPALAKGHMVLVANQISNALLRANSVIVGGGQLLSNIDGKIIDATQAIGTVSTVLMEAPKVIGMVGSMVDTFASQFGDSVVQPGLNEAIAEVQPSLNQVNDALLTLEGVVGQVRGPLQAGQEWQQELQSTFQNGASQINGAMGAAKTGVDSFFKTFNYLTDNPFQHYGATELKKKLRKEFKEEFLGTKIVADVQVGIKQRLFDYEAQFKQGFDSYFQQINQVMRDLISQSLAGLDNSINSALGDLKDYMGSGQISGHAIINDDSLRYLRVDGTFEWKVPDKMTFSAFLEIKEIDSENTAPGCTYAGGTATEVKLGANDVDLDWISEGLRVDVEVQFVIGNDGTPRGIGGAFQTRGDLKFGGFVVKQIGFAVAFGENDNYIAANVRAAFGDSVEIAGGVYFGRSCVLTPLRTAVAAVSPTLLEEIDPEELFGSPPYTGAFVYAEGTFPIWSVGCLFEVRVTVGAGAWYFVEGPRYGGLIKAGVGGTIICVLSASGDITLIGSKKPEGMVFVGVAHVEGCFGPCPFCICVDTSTAVKYVEGQKGGWDAKDP